MIKFKDIKVGDFVTFFALVLDCKLRTTVNQTPYFGLTLSDGNQSLDARIWDVNLKKDIKIGSIYQFEAKINDFGGKMQAIIGSVSDVSEDEIDWHDFYRFAPISEKELRRLIGEYIERINNPILKNLVQEIIHRVEKDFFTFPAGLTMHHNYICGLAYHTYSMLRMAERLLELYPSLNRDLLFSGILIHDVGKTKELTEAKLPSYSQSGNLLGHLVIGTEMLAIVAEKQGVSDTEEVLALSHLLISHHGELEYGSPKEPLMMEAHALFFIDHMDSRLASIEDEVSRTEKGNATGPIATLNRRSLYVPDLEN